MDSKILEKYFKDFYFLKVMVFSCKKYFARK